MKTKDYLLSIYFGMMAAFLATAWFFLISTEGSFNGIAVGSIYLFLFIACYVIRIIFYKKKD